MKYVLVIKKIPSHIATHSEIHISPMLFFPNTANDFTL